MPRIKKDLNEKSAYFGDYNNSYVAIHKSIEKRKREERKEVRGRKEEGGEDREERRGRRREFARFLFNLQGLRCENCDFISPGATADIDPASTPLRP